MKPEEEPIDISKFAFMPTFLEQSSVDIRAAGLQVCYSDEDSQISLEFSLDSIKLQLKTEPERLNYTVSVVQCQCSLVADTVRTDIFKVGRRDVLIEKENLFSAVFKRQPARVEHIETALLITGEYSPTAFRRQGGAYPKAKYHDLSINVSPVSMVYSNSTIGFLLQLYEAFVLDKAKRDNLAVESSPLSHREPVLGSRKYQLDVALKRFVLTKAFLQQFIEWQSRLKTTLKEAELMWRDINFSFKVKTSSSTVTFNDSAFPMLTLTLPSGDHDFSRVETTTSVSLWGWSLSSSRSLLDLHDYFSVRHKQRLIRSLGKKFKRIQRLFDLRPSMI
jgi:hypothetical protein